MFSNCSRIANCFRCFSILKNPKKNMQLLQQPPKSWSWQPQPQKYFLHRLLQSKSELWKIKIIISRVLFNYLHLRSIPGHQNAIRTNLSLHKCFVRYEDDFGRYKKNHNKSAVKWVTKIIIIKVSGWSMITSLLSVDICLGAAHASMIHRHRQLAVNSRMPQIKVRIVLRLQMHRTQTISSKDTRKRFWA